MAKSPCRGCRKDVDEITGNFPMKFIGKPDGKFMKGAPGSYTHGETYRVPYHYSHFPYWEFIGEKPELVVPEDSDGEEFEDALFLPVEEVEETISFPEVEVTETPSMGVPAIISEQDYDKKMRAIQQGNQPYTVDKDGLIDYVTPVKEFSRKELKKLLDDAGVDYNTRARTHNLQKLVDELDQNED